MCQSHYGILYVKVISAIALTPYEMTTLKKSLIKRLKKSKIDLHNQIDPSVIGGIKIEAGAVSIDETFKSRIELMKRDSLKLERIGE
jgi:F-type H+-transporting ATPase subunit delta